jgi:hypothetical protein
LDIEPSQPISLLWCADEAADLLRREWLSSLNRVWLTSVFIVDAQ